MITPPKKIIFVVLWTAAIGAFALCCHTFIHQHVPSYAKPDFNALASSAIYGSSPFDGVPIVLEGYWYGPYEGFSINGAPNVGGQGVLMRPHPRWSSPRPRFAESWFLPYWLSPDPVIVESNDYVRITGTYHATGYAPPGQLLDSCGWLEFDTVERWDSRHRRWRSADVWL